MSRTMLHTLGTVKGGEKQNVSIARCKGLKKTRLKLGLSLTKSKHQTLKKIRNLVPFPPSTFQIALFHCLLLSMRLH